MENSFTPIGTYTQIPNVFFDTCGLPETVQILFLRLYSKIGYKDCVYRGSIRKLAHAVGLSKSQVERGLKQLSESRLIALEHSQGKETAATIMIVTLNRDDLWKLNEQYSNGREIPTWIVLPNLDTEWEPKGDKVIAKLYIQTKSSTIPTKYTRTRDIQSMPYTEYLQTPEWSKKRAKALRFANYKCQLCNSKENLNVHHRTYERLGHELLGDLIVLCNDCHEIFHNNRELS